MLNRINAAIDDFFIENGREAEFIILSSGAYGEFSFEVGKLEGLSDDDAYLNEVSVYKLITVAVTHNRQFNEFEIR